MIRYLSGWICVAAALCISGCSEESAPSRPNIVLILADDLGYSDLGIHGNRLAGTPVLDSLARESIRFSQFYVTPVCATTRASLLTGRHFLRTGVSHVHGGKDFLHLDETTLAERLQEAGYATGMWGKWHSGKTPGYYPWERGFDEAFMATLYRYRDNRGLYNGEPLQTEGRVTGVLTDFAIEFIRENRREPFFAYLPYLTCHSPLDAPLGYVDRYREKGLSDNLATLYGMVEHMDHHIGRLLDSLEAFGLKEQTLVIFLSDNGPAVLNNLLTDEDRSQRYVNGLRGHKGDITENGIRSPLFLNWPGRLEPGVTGRLSDVTDLFPTLLRLAGVPISGDGPLIDGRDLLEGEGEREIFLYANPGWPPTDRPWTPEGVRDEYRPWKYSSGEALAWENQIVGLRSGPHKLLKDSSSYELFHIPSDPGERSNLASADTVLKVQMESRLKEMYTEMIDSPHAFEMPVFLLGDEPSKSWPVLAYAPRRTSPGVKSAFNYLTGFTSRGDSAEYMVRCAKGGVYDVSLRYRLNAPDPLAMALSVSGERFPFRILPGEGSVDIEGIGISKGISSFALVRTGEGDEPDLRLYEMILRIHQSTTYER